MHKKLPDDVLEWFRKARRQRWCNGGSEGGETSAANMTPEEKVGRAKHAVAVREAKRAQRKRSRRSP